MKVTKYGIWNYDSAKYKDCSKIFAPYEVLAFHLETLGKVWASNDDA